MQDTQGNKSGGPGKEEDRFGAIVPAGEYLGQSVNALSSQKRKNSPARKNPPTRKGRKGCFLPLLVAFFLTLLVSYLGAVYFLFPFLVRGPLSRQLGLLMDCQVQVDQVALSPLSLRCTLEEVRLAARERAGKERPWFQAAALAGTIQPLSLLRGQLRVENLVLDRPELSLRRQGSGPYTLPTNMVQFYEWVGKHHWGIAPDWFSFQIEDGTLLFDDHLGGRNQRIEHITYQSSPQQGLQLHAVVNGRAVAIQGKGYSDSPVSAKPLHLQLEGLELEQYLPYLPMQHMLPGPISGLVNGTLDITSSEAAPGNIVSIQGELALKDLHLGQEQDGLILQVPTGRLAFALQWPSGFLVLREGLLREPSLLVTGESGAKLLRIFRPLREKTTLGRLLVAGGQVTFAGSDQTCRLQDVQLSLQGPETRTPQGVNGQVLWQLTAELHGGQGDIAMDGKYSAGNLQGHLRVHDADFSHAPTALRGFLLLQSAQGLVDVESDIGLTFSTHATSPSFFLRNNLLHLHDFTLQARDWGDISGKNLLCQAVTWSFNHTGTPFFCDRLDVEEAELVLPVTQLVVPELQKGDAAHRYWFRDLDMKDSILHLVDKKANKLLSLNQLRLQIHGFPGRTEQPAQVGLQASIGKEGQFRATGILKEKIADWQYGVDEVALSDVPAFSSWLGLPVQEGLLRGRGQMDFPQAKVTGTVVVENFHGGDEHSGFLLWQEARVQDVTLRLGAPTVFAKELFVHAPQVQLTDSSGGVDALLAQLSGNRAFFQNKLQVQHIGFDGGVLQSPTSLVFSGHPTTLTNLTGKLDRGSEKEFELDVQGELQGGFLHIGNMQEGTNSPGYGLQLEHCSLAPVAEEVAARFGVDVSTAIMSYQQPLPLTSSSRWDSGTCIITNMRPKSAVPLGPVLARLLDENGDVHMSLPPGPTGRHPWPLVDAVMEQLRRIHLREVVLPGSTLADQFPFLELPSVVGFRTGNEESDELFFLDDYAELLKKRPQLQLVLTGNIDRMHDAATLQEIFQEEADARIAAKNLHRQQQKAKWLRLQDQSVATAKTTTGVVVESTVLHDIPADLEPLSREHVEVPQEVLETLAEKRAMAIRTYLLTKKGVSADQVVVSPLIDTQGALVTLRIEPPFSKP